VGFNFFFSKEIGVWIMVRKLIHLEGFIILAATIYLYSLNNFSWWVFILLLFAPDVSMFAYMINKQVGASVYNFFHTYLVTIIVSLAGALLNQDALLMVGLIWTAHIGMDRLCGFGLKYQTSFQDTHIQRM